MNPKQLFLGIIVGVIVVGGAVYLYSVSTRPPFVPFLTPQPSQSPQISMPLGTSPLVKTSPLVTLGLLEASFQAPYPVTWEGENRAVVSLTKVSLGKISHQGKEIFALTLSLKINADGGFCTDSFKSTNALRRLINEYGDLASADNVPSRCSVGKESLSDQRIIFVVPESEKEFNFLTFTRSNAVQAFFSVTSLDDGTLKVEQFPIGGEG